MGATTEGYQLVSNLYSSLETAEQPIAAQTFVDDDFVLADSYELARTDPTRQVGTKKTYTSERTSCKATVDVRLFGEAVPLTPDENIAYIEYAVEQLRGRPFTFTFEMLLGKVSMHFMSVPLQQHGSSFVELAKQAVRSGLDSPTEDIDNQSLETSTAVSGLEIVEKAKKILPALHKLFVPNYKQTLGSD